MPRMIRPTLQLATCALLATFAIAQPTTTALIDPHSLSTVEGVTLGANRVPLAGANVALFGISGAVIGPGIITSSGDQAISDAQGRFSFQNVLPGRYILDASHPDYSPGVGTTRVIRALQDGAIDTGPGSLLVTAGQHLTGIEINLIPLTVLSGKVTDENGDPMQNVTIRPMRADTVLNGRRRLANAGAAVQTDAEGRYRFTVYSGRWYLSFMPSRQGPQPPAPADPEHTYVTTYFPGVTEMPLATGIDVSGQPIPELNVRLRKTRIYHVHGKIVGVKPSPDFRIVPVQETGSARPSIVDEGRPVQEDGTFDVSGLTPGPWTLIVCQYGKLESFGRRSIRIGDNDINDVAISFQPPAELRGRVSTIPDQPIVNPPPFALPQIPSGQGLVVSTRRSWSVQLTPLDSMLTAAGVEVEGDGAFTLKNIQSGKYRVDVSVPPGAYVKSMALDGRPCLDSMLDLSSGATASGALQVIVSLTAAEISGTVANPNGTAFTTATVTLVPDGPPTAIYRPDLRAVTRTDATGHFIITSVAPGTYRVYAWEHVDPLPDLPGAPGGDPMPFSDPDFPRLFDNMSALVTVAENDHKQVSLSLISGAKIDAATGVRR